LVHVSHVVVASGVEAVVVVVDVVDEVVVALVAGDGFRLGMTWHGHGLTSMSPPPRARQSPIESTTSPLPPSRRQARVRSWAAGGEEHGSVAGGHADHGPHAPQPAGSMTKVSSSSSSSRS
jgi:hypothetical protein